MTGRLPVGVGARVSVPATCANLGPGFDSLGLALDLRDQYSAVVTREPGVRVRVAGVDLEDLPTNEDHLVARALAEGLREWGRTAPGLDLHCRNAIPHARGLGSSAAAIVGGLALAAGLSERSDVDDLLGLAARIEGHPDNVAAALLGGFTIAWTDDDGGSAAITLPVHPDIRVVLYVPEATSPTRAARALLPAEVPHEDAGFNAGRAALLVAAMTRDPTLLFQATKDRLHQDYRREAYPEAMRLVDRLRARRVAAVVSGAGPAVVAFVTAADLDEARSQGGSGYRGSQVVIGPGVRILPRHAAAGAGGVGTRATL